MTSLTSGTKTVLTAFLVSGVVHLVRPQVFEPIMPAPLPFKRELVYASGVAELLCGAGLLLPRTRRAAGLGSAVLLIAVFPANVQMAVDAHRAVKKKGSTPKRQLMRAAAFARLPVQLPLIKWALRPLQ